jgi:hypothetical protein
MEANHEKMDNKQEVKAQVSSLVSWIDVNQEEM